MPTQPTIPPKSDGSNFHSSGLRQKVDQLTNILYAGVATASLIFQKGKPTESVWFYDITADGFSLDDKRTPIDANDIPDVLAKWPAREEGPNSYRVLIERIEENDLSLAAGRYKPVKVEAVQHDAPADILKEVLTLEELISEKARRLLKGLS